MSRVVGGADGPGGVAAVRSSRSRARWRPAVLLAAVCWFALLVGVSTPPPAAADVVACPAGTTAQQFTAGGFDFSGCGASIARAAGGPLYLLSGPVSLGGVTIAPTGATTAYPAGTFANCSADPCAAAAARFWAATDGAQIVVDPSSLQVESNRPYAISLTVGSASISIYSGRVHIPPPLSSASALIDLDVTRGAALLGLPLQGRFQVFAQPGGVRIHVNVGLPSLLGGVTGETDVSVLDNGSVALNQLRLTVGEAQIKGLTISGLEFVYDSSLGLWQGSASLTLPSPSAYHLTIKVKLLNNAFSSIAGSISNLNVSLGYGVFLQGIGAQFQLTPSVVIGGSISLSAGPTVLSRTAMAIDGALRILFPGRQTVNGVSVNVPYTRIEADGSLSVVGSTLATGYIHVQTNGYVEAAGSVAKSGSFGSLEATLRGEVGGTAFNLEGQARVAVKFGFTFHATGRAIVSSKGLAACADFGWLSGGLGYQWGKSFAVFRGCDLGAYRVVARMASVRPGARIAKTPADITIPAGTPEAAITVHGTTAPPEFTLLANRGTRIVTPVDDTVGRMAPTYAIIRQTETNTTTVVLRAPAAGQWHVFPVAGSSPISSIDEANGLPPAQASVTVTGSGRTRALHWTLRSEPGQVVRFVERGLEDAVVLATTNRPTGSVTFRVPDGLAGARPIEAQFEEAGLPRADLIVGRYSAPGPPTPPRPASFGARREGAQVNVTWSQPAPAPDHYEMVWQASDGEEHLLELPGSARNAVFSTDLPSDSVSVVLRPFAADGVAGLAARLPSR